MQISLTIPAFIPYIEYSCSKCSLCRSFGDSRIIQVTHLSISFSLWISHILAQNHIRERNGRNALQHLHLQGEPEGIGHQICRNKPKKSCRNSTCLGPVIKFLFRKRALKKIFFWLENSFKLVILRYSVDCAQFFPCAVLMSKSQCAALLIKQVIGQCCVYIFHILGFF